MFGPKVDAGKVAIAVEETHSGYSVYANVSLAGGGGSENFVVIVATGGEEPSVSEFLAVCLAVTSNVDEGWTGYIEIGFVESLEPADGGPYRWLDIRGVTDQLDMGHLSVSTSTVMGSRSQFEQVCPE